MLVLFYSSMSTWPEEWTLRKLHHCPHWYVLSQISDDIQCCLSFVLVPLCFLQFNNLWYNYTKLYEPKKLTTSSLITAIRAVLMPITATRGKDTLTIATMKRSTLTRSCRNCNNIVLKYIQQLFGLKLATVKTYCSSSHHFHQNMI